MRFPRRDDPTDPTDPDELAMMNGSPKPLLWTAAKGAALLAVAVGLTWAAGTLLQDRANVEQVATPTPVPTSR
jgi:hypothetical protein